MLIKKDKEVDAFFLSEISRNDRHDLHLLSIQFMTKYIECLSEYLKLDFRDSHHLAKEMTYHSVCMFLDAAYRVNNANPQPVVLKDNNNYEEYFFSMFSGTIPQMSFTSSRILRSKIANLISFASNRKHLFDNIRKEPSQTELKNIGLTPSFTEVIISLYYYLRYQLPNSCVDFLKVIVTKIMGIYRQNASSVGYIAIQKRYFFQFNDINFVPINIDLSKYFDDVPINRRLQLYNHVKLKFIEKCNNIDFKIFQNLDLNNNNKQFIEALLSIIVLKTESLLCDPIKLNKAINYCEDEIAKKNVLSLFSSGNWFRFQNAIISTAGRGLRLPIIEYQNGGTPIYNLGYGFDWGPGKYERGNHLDFYLAWGGKYLKHNQFPDIYKVPNPYLYNIKGRYKKRSKLFNRNINIQFTSIGLSGLYNTELWNGFTSMDMFKHRSWIKEIFQHLDVEITHKNVSLFIKVKGFGYTLFEAYPWLLFQELSCNNIKIHYLLKGVSVKYLSYMDLHVFDGPATTFVESMVYNVPSICLWNSKIYLVKNEYVELFDLLHSIGIICLNQEEFISSTKQFLEDREYWFSIDVQKVRKEFMKNLAYTSADWRTELQIMFTTIKDKSLDNKGSLYTENTHLKD